MNLLKHHSKFNYAHLMPKMIYLKLNMGKMKILLLNVIKTRLLQRVDLKMHLFCIDLCYLHNLKIQDHYSNKVFLKSNAFHKNKHLYKPTKL